MVFVFPRIRTSLGLHADSHRFAPLLEKSATLEDPSRVIVTASVAGLATGTLGEHATFGYSASKAAVIVSLLEKPNRRHYLRRLRCPFYFLHLNSSTNAHAHDSPQTQHLVKNLAVELGPRHILCNAIAPGLFPSRMANGLMEAMGGQEDIAREHPNRRIGRSEDIAAAVVYLGARSGSHVNGAVITIDGGNVLVRGSKL